MVFSCRDKLAAPAQPPPGVIDVIIHRKRVSCVVRGNHRIYTFWFRSYAFRHNKGFCDLPLPPYMHFITLWFPNIISVYIKLTKCQIFTVYEMHGFIALLHFSFDVKYYIKFPRIPQYRKSILYFIEMVNFSFCYRVSFSLYLSHSLILSHSLTLTQEHISLRT